MRISQVLGYIFAFVLSVLAGYWLGQQFAPQTLVSETNTDFASPGAAEAGQINILLTQVNQLNTKHPGLQVIWLVAIKPNTPIQLIPIFPFATLSPAKDAELAQIFGLKKRGSRFDLTAKTAEYIRGRGLTWEGSIVLESRALADFINTFGKINLKEETLDPDQLAANQFPMFETAQQSLTFHTLLWREICWNILHSPANIPELSRDFRKHASWVFSKEIDQQDWAALLSSVEVPSCEFPMYHQVSP
jgi:hypothetical protein